MAYPIYPCTSFIRAYTPVQARAESDANTVLTRRRAHPASHRRPEDAERSEPRPSKHAEAAELQRRQISRQKRQDENYLRGASRMRAYSKERKKRRLWDPPGSDSASRRERKDTGTATSAPHPVESRDTATNLARPTMRQRDNSTRRPSRAQPASTWVDLTRSAHAHALIGH